MDEPVVEDGDGEQVEEGERGRCGKVRWRKRCVLRKSGVEWERRRRGGR